MDDLRQCFVRDALAASVTEFFDAYGLTCDIDTTQGPDAEEPELGSILGFRGSQVRGGLAFVASVDLVSALLPVANDGERSDGQLRDWIAEIANQLLGRLKNKLAVRAIDFDTGTAVCFTGRAIRLVFLPGATGLSLTFRAADTAIRIHLDCAIAPTVMDHDIQDIRIIPEGDVLLF